MKRWAIIIGVLAIAGCATPHRSSHTTHTLEYFRGRSDGLVSREEWRDKYSAGCGFLFTDPSSQGFCDKQTNAFGGGSWFMMAPFSMVVDSNLVPFVAASGTAIGNVVGAAVKTAVKP